MLTTIRTKAPTSAAGSKTIANIPMKFESGVKFLKGRQPLTSKGGKDCKRGMKNSGAAAAKLKRTNELASGRQLLSSC
jgi:hypothetical protein